MIITEHEIRYLTNVLNRHFNNSIAYSKNPVCDIVEGRVICEEFNICDYINQHDMNRYHKRTVDFMRTIAKKDVKSCKKTFIVPITCRRTGLKPTRHIFEQVTNQKLLYYIMTISVYRYDIPTAKVPAIQIVSERVPLFIPLDRWFPRSMDIGIPISMLSPDLQAILDNMIVK
jgi:hypothetical protein